MIPSQVITLLLQQCKFVALPSELAIICSNAIVAAKLVKARKMLVRSLMTYCSEETKAEIIAKKIKSVTIAVGKATTSFPINQDRVLAMDTVIKIPPRQNLLAPVIDLIDECMAYDGACGVVRMSDHKGLFSNAQIVLSSNAHPNDWLGKKMSDFWIEPELDKYLERLRQDEELRNYSYVAKMMTGENARLTVNARMVIWNGEPARLVKTISRELLS